MKRCLLPILAGALALSSCEESLPPFDQATALELSVSGEKAFSHVKAFVEMGPRPAGSDAIEKSRVYIEEQLASSGWEVKRQTFSAKTPDGEKEFINLRARFKGTSWEKGVAGLLCSHYDTKLFGGFDFVGANDGASSTGLLIELGRVLSEKPALASRIELVFFDGEEAFGPNITPRDGLYGSKHYASEMVLLKGELRPRWGLLLDMVGDAELNIRAGVMVPRPPIQATKSGGKEQKEHVNHEAIKQARDVMARQLLQAAKDLELRNFVGISPDYITDDHVPLNVSAGIPAIDLIDFDYPYWHTPADTIDKLDPRSLEVTGRITLQLVEKYLMAP